MSLKFSSPTSGGIALKHPAWICCSREDKRSNAFSVRIACIRSSITSRHLFINSYNKTSKSITFWNSRRSQAKFKILIYLADIQFTELVYTNLIINLLYLGHNMNGVNYDTRFLFK